MKNACEVVVWCCGLLFAVCFFCGIVEGQTATESRLNSEVENFNTQLGFASKIQQSSVAEFCELVDDQKEEILVIRRDTNLEAARIKRSKNSLKRKLEMLQELRSNQDVLLKNILLPHQKARLNSMTLYNIVIYEEGCTGSA